MMWTICYLITFLACIIGTICGMGGGIIIKPVLDATGLMSVSTITFLSGCTVIAMAAWSIGKNLLKGESALDVCTTGVLAVSAAAGGLLGKQLYALTAGLFANRNTAGGVQAALLLAATFATLIYTLRKDRLSSRHISSPWANLIIGLLLGLLGAFLGIGGGPFNVAVLCYFFSMPTKRATQNSLLIVLFSQLASALKTVLIDGAPTIRSTVLLGMMIAGVVGSEIGRLINRKIDNRQATICLEGAMLLIMGISMYNIVLFFA